MAASLTALRLADECGMPGGAPSLPHGKACLERGYQACWFILQTGIGFGVAAEAVYGSGFRKKTGIMLVFGLAWLSQAHEHQREDPVHQRPDK